MANRDLCANLRGFKKKATSARLPAGWYERADLPCSLPSGEPSALDPGINFRG